MGNLLSHDCFQSGNFLHEYAHIAMAFITGMYTHRGTSIVHVLDPLTQLVIAIIHVDVVPGRIGQQKETTHLDVLRQARVQDILVGIKRILFVGQHAFHSPSGARRVQAQQIEHKSAHRATHSLVSKSKSAVHVNGGYCSKRWHLREKAGVKPMNLVEHFPSPNIRPGAPHECSTSPGTVSRKTAVLIERCRGILFIACKQKKTSRKRIEPTTSIEVGVCHSIPITNRRLHRFQCLIPEHINLRKNRHLCNRTRLVAIPNAHTGRTGKQRCI